MMSYGSLDDASLPRAQICVSDSSNTGLPEKPFPFIDFHELEIVEKIARGGMAEISLYKCAKPGLPSLVAVKTLFKGSVTTSERSHLKSEMSILNKICHLHIVTMFGVVETDRDFGLVMEYLQFGSYRKFFGDIRENIDMTQDLEKSMIPLKIRLIDEIVNAMAYLHGMKPKEVLHLDMKSDNVLLDCKLQAKICDFGLSRMSTLTSLRSRTAMSIGNVGGTPGYIAPERLRDIREKPTSKSDVYSFAILMWEIATDRTPYEEIKIGNDYQLLSQLICNKDLRPDKRLIPRYFPEDLVKLMTFCWTTIPADRPSFAVLQLELTSIKNGIPQFEEQARSSTTIVLGLRRSICISTLSNCRSISHETLERARTGLSESVTSFDSNTVERQTLRVPALPDHSTTAIKHVAHRNYAENSESPAQANSQSASDTNSQRSRENSFDNVPDPVMPPEYEYYENHNPIDAQPSSEREPLIHRFVDEEKKCFSTTFFLLILTILAVGVAVGVICFIFVENNHAKQKCPKVEAPKHGNMTCSNGTDALNKKCSFSCDRGYEMVGVDVIVCSAGNWNDKPPICEPVCDLLVPVSHGKFFCTNRNFVNSTCIFTCEDNHNIQGATILTCQQGRQWSEPEPTCVCPACKAGGACQFSSQWKDVSDMLDSLCQYDDSYDAISVNYGGYNMTCTCRKYGLHSIDVKWSGRTDWLGVCTDDDSGDAAQCDDDFTPAEASKQAASRLIRRLVNKKIYPKPCDPQAMEKSCSNIREH